MNTDKKTPHYGKMPGVHPRANKIIFLRDKYSIDGEDATQMITIGTMLQREAFVDQLADAYCANGLEGLEEDFKEWLAGLRNNGFKPK